MQKRLLVEVEDDTAGNLACLESLVCLLEGRQGLSLEDNLNLAARSDFDGLVGILSVSKDNSLSGLLTIVEYTVNHSPDIRTVDVDALDDSLEDTSTELGMSWETDDHEGSSRAKVVDSLLVSGGGGGGDNGGVWAETVGGGDDVLDKVLGLLEVDPLLSTKREDEVPLLSTGIDGKNTEASGSSVLDSQVSKSSSGTGENDPVADLGSAVLDGTVDGYTLSNNGSETNI